MFVTSADSSVSDISADDAADCCPGPAAAACRSMPSANTPCLSSSSFRMSFSRIWTTLLIENRQIFNFVSWDQGIHLTAKISNRG